MKKLKSITLAASLTVLIFICTTGYDVPHVSTSVDGSVAAITNKSEVNRIDII
jgi:hypothetical protein